MALSTDDPQTVRGPQRVDGSYAPPSIGSGTLPSSFGENIDFASAFEGTISDLRAASSELRETTGNFSVIAQRMSQMLGGSSLGGDTLSTPVPHPVNIPPPISDVSPGGIAGISEAMQRNYGGSFGGSAMGMFPMALGGTMGSEVSISPGLSGVSYRSTLPPVEQPPQAQDVSGVPGSQGGKPSVGTSIPKDGEDERPSLKTFLEGAIGERLKEHGDEGTKVPSDGKWHKESEADKYEAKKQQAEDYLAGKATPGVPGQKVGADFGDMFRLGRHPTLQGIAQHAQQKFSGLNPQNMTRKNDTHHVIS